MASQIKSAHILRSAESAARGAGKILMRYFGKLRPSDISQKHRGDFVTVADKASESFLMGLLTRHFPEDAVLSEEFGVRAGGGRRWVMDPLDGTGNFVHGIPVFAVSIGIVENGRSIAGVVFNPATGEMFSARRGHGAYLNGHRLSVSTTASLSGALVGTAVPSKSRHRFPGYISVLRSVALEGCDIRRSGSLALELASVAAGRLDGLWAFDQAPWDSAAGCLLVMEAGGRFEQKTTPGGADLVASNGRIHRALTKRMRAQRAL